MGLATVSLKTSPTHVKTTKSTNRASAQRGEGVVCKSDGSIVVAWGWGLDLRSQVGPAISVVTSAASSPSACCPIVQAMMSPFLHGFIAMTGQMSFAEGGLLAHASGSTRRTLSLQIPEGRYWDNTCQRENMPSTVLSSNSQALNLHGHLRANTLARLQPP